MCINIANRKFYSYEKSVADCIKQTLKGYKKSQNYLLYKYLEYYVDIELLILKLELHSAVVILEITKEKSFISHDRFVILQNLLLNNSAIYLLFLINI